MVRLAIKTKIKNLIPAKWYLMFYFNWLKKTNRLDKEMLFIRKLLRSERKFIDIGANIGIYSYYFSKYFNKIEAFEPLPSVTEPLRLSLRSNVAIHNIALSNDFGKLQLYVPLHNNIEVPGLASLEVRKKPFHMYTVDVMKLDDFGFSDVDLIKIDVEGHEYQVIEGAYHTIKKYRPVIIVEVEQRHLKIDMSTVFNLLLSYGYSGFFLKNKRLIEITKFSYEAHQKPFLNNRKKNFYINNFIFIHNTHAEVNPNQ